MAILEPLSYKQQKFCEEYLLSFNAYRAALTAGYTDNTARKGDLLHVPKIQAYLKEAMKRSAARAELTHDMLLRELMKVAFCNMGNYYDDHGDPKRMHQLTDDEKAAISYFQRADVTGEDGHITGELFKIKLHNKMAAIDKLCRHTGFYKANWQPNVVLQPEETEEDIAFEAQNAKTVAEPFTDEVSEELLEQFGVEVGGQKSDVGEEDGLDIVGEDTDDGVEFVSGIANPLFGGSRIENPDQRRVGGQKSDAGEEGLDIGRSVGGDTSGTLAPAAGRGYLSRANYTPLHPSQEGNRARPALPLVLVKTQTGLSVESSVPSFAEATAGKDNILTLSPLPITIGMIESRGENQESRVLIAL
ncbi:terminase small subunit [Mucilaginibacter sp. HMF5004]|uniref:terminase small subunit n=1 Tax=Mucilaginibacter rivuli TaxID=2857527 RepID=UPI001C5E733F|nr:terminase small subunit [Mucilaginibacter rivuli]MBW4890481.1 terminase small subunit [Mucilaginibacter rivuli]